MDENVEIDDTNKMKGNEESVEQKRQRLMAELQTLDHEKLGERPKSQMMSIKQSEIKNLEGNEKQMED